MITNTGRSILSKYLIGQVQSYASYIAIGCGPEALTVGVPFPDFSEKKNLDFETLRMPIISRGFVYDELGNPTIVFAAEIPSDERFEITEVGVYPGKSNPAAAGRESRVVFSLSAAENWQYHQQLSAQNIPLKVEPLSRGGEVGEIAITEKVFRTNSNNTLFAGPIRIGLNERPRFLGRSMMVRGDLSYLQENVDGNLEFFEDGINFYKEHIHYNGINLSFDSNSPDDEFRLAFSVVGKTEDTSPAVSSVRIMVEFASSDVDNPPNYARFEAIVNQSDADVNFANNRYFVVSKKLSELVQTAGFSWKDVSSARIFATVIESGQTTPSSNFYVSLDGFRFENTTTQNPIYGLTGYTRIKTDDGNPIVKEPNSSNIIEFRFGMDVL